METISATDASNKFGALLDKARLEPVKIKKQGRDVAVMLSSEEYKRMEHQLERVNNESIAQGLKDIEEGRLVDGEVAFEKLFQRFK